MQKRDQMHHTIYLEEEVENSFLFSRYFFKRDQMHLLSLVRYDTCKKNILTIINIIQLQHMYLLNYMIQYRLDKFKVRRIGRTFLSQIWLERLLHSSNSPPTWLTNEDWRSTVICAYTMDRVWLRFYFFIWAIQQSAPQHRPDPSSDILGWRHRESERCQQDETPTGTPTGTPTSLGYCTADRKYHKRPSPDISTHR